MVLVGKARHVGVGLGLQHGRQDAPLGLGLQQPHAPAMQQARDQGRDEDRLASARKAESEVSQPPGYRSVPARIVRRLAAMLPSAQMASES